MIYLVYKTKEEKDAILKQMIKIRKFIYGDEDISSIDKGVKIVPYSEIKEDRGLVIALKQTNGQTWEKNNITYYKRYGESNALAEKFYKESIIFSMMFYNSGTEKDISLPLFHAYVYSDMNSKYMGYKDSDSVTASLCKLGLLAFSKEVDPNVNNDLTYTALYNRKGIKDIYEEIMGESSFDSFMEICSNFSDKLLTPQLITDEEFYVIIETLKKFFYLRVDRLDNLSLNEKNSMIVHFNDEYSKLVKKFEDEKEEFRSFSLRL